MKTQFRHWKRFSGKKKYLKKLKISEAVALRTHLSQYDQSLQITFHDKILLKHWYCSCRHGTGHVGMYNNQLLQLRLFWCLFVRTKVLRNWYRILMLLFMHILIYFASKGRTFISARLTRYYACFFNIYCVRASKLHCNRLVTVRTCY